MGKKVKKKVRNNPPSSALPTPPSPSQSPTMTNQSQGETAPTPKPPRKLVFSKRLQGFDDTWESLIPLFEELQLFSADVANPTLDLLTFAQTAHYFSVLHLKKVVGNEGESSVEEDDSRCHPSGANPSARSQGVTFSDVEDEFEGQGSIWPSWETSEPRNGIPIGFVYLQNSQNMDDYQRSGEFNVGVIVAERHRGKGYARQAVQKAFEVAFRDQNCHRVQAVLVDSPYRDKALSLFMMSGMGHEGVRRRGFRSPWDHEVKDVTYLGLLATDWFIRDGAFFKTGKWTPAPKSLWDEMFARHQREREELLRWEEKKMSTSGLKRTNSMETIKQATASAMSDIDDDMYESESVVAGGDAESVRAGSVVSSSSSSLSSAFSRVSMESPRKRRRTSIKSEGTSGSWSRAGSEPPSSNESDSGDDIFGNEEPVDGPLGNLMVAPESHIPEGLRNWLAESSTAGFDVNQPHRGQSPTFSEDSDLTEISDGYATSTSSRWDVVERGSTPGLSDLEPDQDPLNI